MDKRFTDNHGRTINIIEEYPDICAFYKDNKIGEIQFDERDGQIILLSMDVTESYRRAGIATEMMRLAVEIHGPDFSKPSFSAVGGKNANAEDYYTQEGAALIRHCIEQGILEDTESREDEELIF